jgi:prepilin-type N-terminal cleavage/methylation domain-containing protein
MGTNPPAAARGRRAEHGARGSRDGGFSLVELLVSLFLISVAILSMASLVSTGTFINFTSANLTSVTTLASQRAEQLSSVQYGQLTGGGSLTAAVEGFSESVDVDGDGETDVTLRWRVTDLGTGKRIEVFATAADAVMADRQSITLVALVAKP